MAVRVTSLYPTSPQLSPSPSTHLNSPNPFLGTVLDQEHKKRNRDGTIVIRMNDLAEQGTNDLNDFKLLKIIT